MLYDFLNIDKSVDKLLYEQLFDNIKSAIGTGKLKKGDKLPSIRGLSQDLGISRTTVETAYEQLCSEGFLNSCPKRGYFVEAEKFEEPREQVLFPKSSIGSTYVKWDFSSSGVDPSCTDLKYWQRCIKDVLESQYTITTYGEAQGEYELRAALCEYSRRVRDVKTVPENIVIGAGTQTLLSILLGLCDEYGYNVAMEVGFFPQGEQIFSDYRWNITNLNADKDGIILDDSVKSRMLFINSSGSIRGCAPIPINKRNKIIEWAKRFDNIVVEDDYNGELRFLSKPVPALQGLCPSHTVYIGSFSKLLLPSVRISYMVLPQQLAQKYKARKKYYNQTSSKTEQLALARYISCGRLDRQLRKLRKTYAEKASVMYEAVNKNFPDDTIVEIIETALCVRIKLKTDIPLDQLKLSAEKNGCRLGKCREKNELKYFYLSFAGISKESIPTAVIDLKNALLQQRAAS